MENRALTQKSRFLYRKSRGALDLPVSNRVTFISGLNFPAATYSTKTYITHLTIMILAAEHFVGVYVSSLIFVSVTLKFRTRATRLTRLNSARVVLTTAGMTRIHTGVMITVKSGSVVLM